MRSSKRRLQPLRTGGVRAFLEDEDQEVLELIWPSPQNNCQRQAMMFFIVDVAIGFVVPLGRDMLDRKSVV